MGTTSLDKERRRLRDRVLSARTLPEIEEARQLLRKWLAAHPEEQGMRDGFEQLAQMQEIAEIEAASGPLPIEDAAARAASN